jgi:hypothetical protein
MVTKLELIKIAELKAWGALCALHILRHGTLPALVSPFLILAVVSGIVSITDLDLIQELAPEQLDYFKMWQLLDDTTVLNHTDHSTLIEVMSCNLNIPVRGVTVGLQKFLISLDIAT